MTATWQRPLALFALLWPAIRYFGAERPFLVPRFPIAPSVPQWLDWLLDLPLIVAMIAIGFSVAPRRIALLVFGIALGHTLLRAALAWLGMPYFSAEGVGDVRFLLLGLTYSCISLGVPALLGFFARRSGIADRIAPTNS